MDGRWHCGGFGPRCWHQEGSPSEGDLLVSLGCHQPMGFVFPRLVLTLIPTSHEPIAGLPRVKASSAGNALQGSPRHGRSLWQVTKSWEKCGGINTFAFYCCGFSFYWHLIHAGRKGCHSSGCLCQNGDLVNCSEIDGTYTVSSMETPDKTEMWKLKLQFIDSTCPQDTVMK